MKKILLLAGLLSIILTPSISFAATSNSAQTEKATTTQQVKNFDGRRPGPHQFDKKRQEEFQNQKGGICSRVSTGFRYRWNRPL